MDTIALKNGSRSCPFPPCSGEVVDKWFVGRKNLIKQIVLLVQPDGEINNYSIVGLPRIGKSSLLKTMSQNEKLLARYERLVVVYVSLNNCETPDDMWRFIGVALLREVKKRFAESVDFSDLKKETEYSGISIDAKRSDIDYDYVCEFAKCLKGCGYRVLMLIDEFDCFSRIAKDRSVVGNLRTIFDGDEFGMGVVFASRRPLGIIEREVSGKINDNESTLADMVNNSERIKPFDEDEIEEYWSVVSREVGHEVSKEYRTKIMHYAGAHPMLLNLLNYRYWTEMESDDYLWQPLEPNLDKHLENLHDAFTSNIINALKNLRPDQELVNSLILYTWGPSADVNKKDLTELMRYGVVDEKKCVKPQGPLAIAVSPHFTDWIELQRYELPFTDVWSETERNYRKLVKRYCEDMYNGDEEAMIKASINKAGNYEKNLDPQKSSTTDKRFTNMRRTRNEKLQQYPFMSNWVIDYSEPSDLPIIFFSRDETYFSQVFPGDYQRDWKNKFILIGEIRNIRYHNNEEGMPEVRTNIAKNYCGQINTLINKFLGNK